MWRAVRLSECLFPCQEEKEVKAEFAKFFNIEHTARHSVDLYTPQILFEFKLDQNLFRRVSRARAVAQALYYVRKLKFGTLRDSVPERICVVDRSSGFFIWTTELAPFYNAGSKYDWDRAPGQPCPVLVDALSKSPIIDKVHVYSFVDVEDEELFVDNINLTLQSSLFHTPKKAITEDNFISVYDHWASYFEKYVRDGHRPSEYFLSDIESGRSGAIPGTNIVLFTLNDGDVSKNVPEKDYSYFWNIYEKVSDPDEIRAIRQKMDRISENRQRRFTGEFFTPVEFAGKAFEYITRTVGPKRWQNGKWRVWDMAAGTGNLEFSLPSSMLKYCYISTLLEDDAAYCKRIFPTATVFQYDYLNDDAYLLNGGEIPSGVAPKLPKNLLDDLKDPEIGWIIFINPPFATSNSKGGEVGKLSKSDVSMTSVRALMAQRGLGETSRELFSQFLYRISVEFRGKTAYLGLFSTLKYLNSNNDQTLRDKIFRYKFERGFMFSSEVFDGNKGRFPVGFLVWNLGREAEIEKQDIVLDVYNGECEKYGTKRILTAERDKFLNKWPQRFPNTATYPPLASAITVSPRINDVRDTIADGFICSLMSKGNDMQNQNYVAILSGPYCSAGGFSVVPANFERSMMLHAARRIPRATWDNDRDQFYQPYTDDLPERFVSDCVVWSAFAPSNNTASMKDVPYKGRIFQMENQMFPFPLDAVRKWPCGLADIKAQLTAANENRFLAKWLRSRRLSHEARAVMLRAEALYSCVYASLGSIRWLDYKIELWDLGWWQVRMAAKAMPQAGPLIRELKLSMNILESKIGKLLPEYGFTPPAVEPLK